MTRSTIPGDVFVWHDILYNGPRKPGWPDDVTDKVTGLGKLEKFVLEAVCSGLKTPMDIYSFVSARETPPQYWGDITLWEKINALADKNPPLVKIEGPNARLPQWEGIADLTLFRVYLYNE